MNKSEFVSALATKSGVTKKDVEAVVNAFSSVVSTEVLNGQSIGIPGLGIFKQKKTAERQGRNPKTGESLTISARTSVAFKMSSSLK